MAQAECITTAIRELMSRGWPLKSTGPLRAAYTEPVLSGNIPHPILAAADSGDLNFRADHLEKLDRRYLDNLFRDLSADAVGVIRNAAEDLREHENWRAS
jgi:hypothetical protein